MAKIFAIADLHLTLSTPEKSMEVFGKRWLGYQEKLKKKWEALVAKDDLVLIAGDISWAMKLETATVDLAFIDALPGKKILLKGNHDYWWGAINKLKKLNFTSLHFLQNDAINLENVSISGARLWNTKEYNFDKLVANGTITAEDLVKAEKIYERELLRLRLSLENMDRTKKLKICMTHFPPIGIDQNQSRASAILKDFGINICVFGHLHGVKSSPFQKREGIKYFLVSADYLDFSPLEIGSY